MISKIKYIIPFLLMQIIFSVIPILSLFYTTYEYTSWSNILQWLINNNFLKILFYTIKTATITSVSTLIITYTIAYIFCQKTQSIRTILLILFFIPAINNFLIQISAIMNLFYNDSNSIFSFIKIFFDTKRLLYSDTITYIGYIYCYLPYMFIPIYSSLLKFNTNFIQASFDLGASFFQTITKIVIPGTKNAIHTGFSLVFVSSCGEFIINEILGGEKKIQVGSIISYSLLQGSLTQYSIVMILCLILSIIVTLLILHFLFKFIIIYFKKI